MKRIVLLLSCLAVVPSGAQADELYRWLDAQGKVHYGDVPPAGATQVTTIKSPAAAAPGEDLPYETRRAQQNFPVTLYVADNCAEACNQARELLSKRGIPFSEKSLITQEDIDAFKALSGSDSVPTLAVGKAFLKGFLAGQWHGELDIAGYPKTAPYRAAGVLPASAPAAASQVAPANPAAQ
ncbi:MAG: glutaredoxin family protein [Gallionella sp.]|nr:glutaredoxin family protein [Gallionella sp.]